MASSGEQFRLAMQAARARSEARLSDLTSQRERLTDWREHVRSAPILATLSAAIAGAVIARSLAGQAEQRPAMPHREQSADAAATVRRTSYAAMALSLAGSLAVQAARQAATRQFHQWLQTRSTIHDSTSSQRNGQSEDRSPARSLHDG